MSTVTDGLGVSQLPEVERHGAALLGDVGEELTGRPHLETVHLVRLLVNGRTRI